MNTKAFVVACLSIIILIASGIIGCQPETSLTPPPAIPAVELYRHMVGEKESNPTRLKHRVDGREPMAVQMIITEIEDTKVRQHFGRNAPFGSGFVECEFDSETSVLSLDRGDYVEVWGLLEKAFPSNLFRQVTYVVKLSDCLMLSPT